MLPYLILLVVVLTTLIVLKISNSIKYRIIPFLFMGVFSGFRYGVGIDTDNYTRIFEYIINGQTTYYNVEIGYEILVKAIYAVGGSQQLVFFIFALTTTYFIYKYIINNSPNYYLSTIIYLCIGPFYLSSMNGIRQALAVAVFAYSLKYIISKKPVKYFLFLFLFSFFHTSLLLMIPFYWILRKTINYKILLLTMPILIGLFKIGIIDDFIRIIGYGNLLNFEQGTFNIQYIFFILLALIIIILTKNQNIGVKNLEIYLNLNYLSIYIILVGLIINNASIIFTRFNSYFFLSFIILIPILVERFKEKKIVITIVILFCILLYFTTLISSRTMVPYQFNINIFY